MPSKSRRNRRNISARPETPVASTNITQTGKTVPVSIISSKTASLTDLRTYFLSELKWIGLAAVIIIVLLIITYYAVL